MDSKTFQRELLLHTGDQKPKYARINVEDMQGILRDCAGLHMPVSAGHQVHSMFGVALELKASGDLEFAYAFECAFCGQDLGLRRGPCFGCGAERRKWRFCKRRDD